MKTKDIVYIALFAALACVLGLLPKIQVIPLVPITAQSIACMLAGAIAGAKRGSLAMVLFAGLIAIGLPVLAGGRGGIGLFMTPSGGFIIGFILAALVIGLLYQKYHHKLTFINEVIIVAIGGIGMVYAAGIPWWAFTADTTIVKAATACLVFIPGDLIKVFLTVFIVRTIRKGYPTLLVNNSSRK